MRAARAGQAQIAPAQPPMAAPAAFAYIAAHGWRISHPDRQARDLQVPEDARARQRLRRDRRPRRGGATGDAGARARARRPQPRRRLRPARGDPRRRRAPTAAVDFWNADGTPADACGNATRCVARLLMDESGAAALDLRTGRGLLRAEDAGGGLTRVNMGPPQLDLGPRCRSPRAMDLDALPLDGRPRRGRHGQPALRLLRAGRRGGRPRRRRRRASSTTRCSPSGPTSSSFRCSTATTIRMRVWERGGMVTLACGSGACAAAVVTARRGLTGRRGHGAARRRRARDRLARRRRLDDRADGAGVRGPARGRTSSGRWRDRAGLRHPRLPAQRLRDRGDEGPRRGGRRRATPWWSTPAPSPPRRCARRASRSAGCSRDNPEARIVVTGCAAQTEPGGLRGDARGRPRARQRREAAPRAPGRGSPAAPAPRVAVGDIMAERRPAAPLIDGLGTRARAYVQVQNGCDHRCTFCIIPYGRGNSRSVPAATVVEQVARLRRPRLQRGGADRRRPDQLGRRPRGRAAARRPRRGGARAACPDLPRLRLSSIDSVEADPRLIEAIGAEPRLMPHLHLSLQAGDDLILKRMKRRHLRDDAIGFCEAMRARRGRRWCSAPTSSPASRPRPRRCSRTRCGSSRTAA